MSGRLVFFSSEGNVESKRRYSKHKNYIGLQKTVHEAIQVKVTYKLLESLQHLVQTQ